MAFFGSINDKTILPYIFDDLTEGLEPLRPPQPPEKPTFLKITNFQEDFQYFQKVGFLGG